MRDVLRDWLESKDFVGESFDLKHIRTGESNSVFQLRGKEDLIVKVESEEGVGDRLAYEAKIIEFLNDKVKMPKLILHEETDFGPVLIQEKVGEMDAEFTQMSPAQREKLFETVYEVHTVDITGLEGFFGEDIGFSTNVTEYFNWKLGKNKKAWKEYTHLVDEIDPELEDLYYRCLELLESAPEREIELFLCHNDFISNMRAGEGQIYLIDWELSGPDLPEYSLVTQMRRDRLSAQQREMMLEEYWKFNDRREIYEDLSEYIWTCFLLDDVLWAAKTLPKKEADGAERIEGKLRDRKKRLKHYIENGELLMEKMYDER